MYEIKKSRTMTEKIKEIKVNFQANDIDQSLAKCINK